MHKEHWEEWFAWYPVKAINDEGWIWLEKVERAYFAWIEGGSDEKYYYRRINK